MATVQCLECGQIWEVAGLVRPRLERMAERHTEATAHIEFRVTDAGVRDEEPAGALTMAGALTI